MLQSYRKIARQVSTPDSAPAGLGSPQAGIGGLPHQQQQQQQQQQTQPALHTDPMQAKDNLNPASQQTGLRNGNTAPPVVSMVSSLKIPKEIVFMWCQENVRGTLKGFFS